MRVDAEGLSKAYGPVQALADVSVGFGPAEVHALVGENGSGKSTLVKILAGLVAPDAGVVSYDGVTRRTHHARDAIAAGVCSVTQEGTLAPTLSVAENLLAERLPRRGRAIRWGEVHRRAQALLDRLGIEIDSRRRVSELRLDQQQLVEIGRAVAMEPRVLILDEATSSLTENQVARLFDTLRSLRADGVTVIFISHRLDEVRAIADRITVLRDGRLVQVFSDVAAVDDDELVTAMVGRPPSEFYRKASAPIGASVLEVERLSTQRLRDVSLSVRSGEIVGVAGLVGSGRTSLVETIFGLWAPEAGTVRIDGRPVTLRRPRHAIEAGVALVPEDRKRAGLVLGSSIATNLSMCRIDSVSRRGLLRPRAERALALEQMSALRIKAPGPAVPVGTLSGGNQQKVVLGRWLATGPRLLLLDEPARGMDVGAKSDLFSIVGDLVGDGMGVLLVSSEIPDLLAMCDRVVALYEGRVVGELAAATATEEAIGHLISGVAPSAPAQFSTMDGMS